MEASPTRPRAPSRPLAVLQMAVDAALARSALALSEMAGQPIKISSTAMGIVRLADVPAAAGDVEAQAIGIYVGMGGDGGGHLLLLLDEPMARQLAALLLGEPLEGIRLEDELVASALAEAGNVACSSFMNTIADATALCLKAQPPAVVADMRGAIVDVAVADIALSGDEALVIGTCLRADGAWETPEGGVDARLLVNPTPEALAAILERVDAPRNGL